MNPKKYYKKLAKLLSEEKFLVKKAKQVEQKLKVIRKEIWKLRQ